jgi:hypothetical protein
MPGPVRQDHSVLELETAVVRERTAMGEVLHLREQRKGRRKGGGSTCYVENLDDISVL